MNKHIMKRISSALLALVLTLSLCPFPASAAEDSSVIHIGTREDWDALAVSCRLDTWSQGRTVILDNDLDLSDAGSIPTFGGTFDGGGHTISSFYITAEGDHLGLFRYVQEGAVVKNLHLKGTIVPSGKLDTVGGVTGVNSGIIENCSFEGFLTGGSGVGGIAGYNGASGQILRCENRSGILSGEHSTGGIAGVNHGSVIGCSNRAQINTQETSIDPQTSTVNWEDLNSTENMPACTDTGGIVGFSKGVLKDCTNEGTVGYPHTGYNVGGVAGRQSGYMSGCVNKGQVRGRKEVGGIVGQMEPYTLLRYEEDTLQKLSRELEVLNSILGDALDSTDATRHQLSGHISAITGQTDQARDQISGLLDDIEGLGSGTVDTVNELGRRIDRFTDQLVPVTDDMETAGDELSRALEHLEDMAASAGDSGVALSAGLAHLRKALSHADDALHTLLTGVPVPLRSGLDGLSGKPLFDRLDELEHTFDILAAMADALPAAMEDMEAALREVDRAADSMDRSGSHIKDTLDELEHAFDRMSSSSDSISGAFHDLKAAIREQSDLPALEFPKLDPGFDEKENALSATLESITGELEAINQTAGLGGDSLSAEFRRIGDQFTVINNVLHSAGEEKNEEDMIVDISDESISSATQGKVTGCRNIGKVEGDVNIGGVAGAMAVEYDFDPEDDIANQGGHSLNYHFFTSVILQGCVNEGAVTARKDCVGGSVGRMDLGVAVDCENYGPVESTGGEYVGGSAGYSRAVIRSCWAKCSLSGTRRVGGIAGFATDVRSCGTLVEITDGASYLGAVVGQADVNCNLVGNTFVSDELGGVDGVSYFGKAAPLTHADFMAQPGVPEQFSDLSLTFTVDDRVIAVLSVPYHGSVSEKLIPQVPQREGYYGSWSNFDRDCLRFDTVVEACYAPLITAVASEDGKVLAEGVFAPNACLSLSECPLEPPEGSGTAFTATCSQPFTALRIAIPEGSSGARILAADGQGGWTKLRAERDGSYLRVELEGSEAQLCLIPQGRQLSPWLLLGVGGGVIAAALLLWKLKHKKSSAPEAEKAESAE